MSREKGTFLTSIKKYQEVIWKYVENMIRTRNVFFFSGSQINEVLTLPMVMDVVELYFKLYSQNGIKCHRKEIFDIPAIGDIRFMAADDGKFFNVKLLGGVDRDPTEGVFLSGVNVLFTLKPIECVCISDAKVLTGIRTGAAGAVAIKYLARKNSKRVAIIGAGDQGYWQLRGITYVCREINHVLVFDINTTKMRNACTIWRKLLNNIEVEPCSNIKKMVQEADIIVTATPSRKPIIKDKWINPGTHINAIGADTAGKQEIESSLLFRSKVVVDDVEQSLRLGELNVPFSAGLITRNKIYSTLGNIVIGQKRGRINEKEITLFDSTGLSFQDLAAHRLLFEKAVYLHTVKKRDVGHLISLNE